jgi:hypothetical protein
MEADPMPSLISVAASAVRAAEKSQPFAIRPEFYEQCQTLILAFHP